MPNVIYLARYLNGDSYEDIAFLDYAMLVEYMKKNDIVSFSCRIINLFH